MAQYAIGIDVGGTKTAYGIFDGEKKIIGRMSHPSNPDYTPEEFFGVIASNARKLAAASNVSMNDLIGIGIGMPSFILYDEGYIIKTANLVKIKNFPARSFLSEKLDGLVIVLDNDARAAGMAECRYGAGRGFENMLFCPLSTGISSSLFVHGKPYRGSYGWAGETGHMVATPGEGLECGCGNRGCYMSWCSGSMIVRHIRNWIAAGEKTNMTELAGGMEKIDSIVIGRAYDSGDPMAVKAINQMAYWLGTWFFNLYISFNVNCFVLGGGLVNMGDKLLLPIRKKFDEYKHDDNPVYFKPAGCWENTGIIGAAELAWCNEKMGIWYEE